MGEVHRARAFGAAGVTKELCIKRIRRSRLADASALSRFVQEARLWMQLSHANIVQVFDFGRIDNDFYLAMEWVDGCDLRALLEDAEARGTPLLGEEALFLAGELARALSYLHDVGDGRSVAHCDLKPSNVLVSRKSEVKLADFGVAVVAESARAGGTRGYIPPTESERVGTGGDLYALGRVISELAACTEVGAARTLLEAIAADLGSPSPCRDAARGIEEELEAALAAARVRSGRSPRERLAGRLALVPPAEQGEHESVQTDASFLASEDAASFLAQMKAGADRTTETRGGPAPPLPAAPPRRGPALGIVLALLAAGLVVPVLASRAGPVADAPAGVGEAPVAAAAPRSPPASPPPAVPVEVAREAPASPPPPAATRRTRPAASVPAAPAPALPAIVRVNARPWAEVEIDGVPRGATPLRGLELPPGHHAVHLSNPATGREETVELELDAGERRDVIADLR